MAGQGAASSSDRILADLKEIVDTYVDLGCRALAKESMHRTIRPREDPGSGLRVRIRSSKHMSTLAAGIEFDVKVKVGRLVEVWAAQLSSLADMLALARRFNAVLIPGRRFVACSDYRDLRVVPPEVLRLWVTNMQKTNAQIERSALILPRDANALRNQVQRAMEEDGHPDRRICLDGAGAKAWLSGVLDEPERVRLSAFLVERRLR